PVDKFAYPFKPATIYPLLRHMSMAFHSVVEMTTQRFEGLLTKARTRRALPPPAARRLIRESAGLTQQEMAEPLGVDQATIARWENGQRFPRTSLLDAYAELLDRLQREVLAS